jgi:hypothetical protein
MGYDIHLSAHEPKKQSIKNSISVGTTPQSKIVSSRQATN